MLLPMVLGQLDVIGRCYFHVAIRFCNLYLFGWCYCHVALLWLLVMLLPSGWCFSLCLYWQILLPLLYVAVGNATFDISCTKRHATVFVLIYLLSDVIAKMADGVVMFIIGRCYCHVANVFATVFVVVLADVIAWWPSAILAITSANKEIKTKTVACLLVQLISKVALPTAT